MVFVIIEKAGGRPKIIEIPRNEWQVMTTALKWKKAGNWQKIKISCIREIFTNRAKLYE